MLSVFMIMLVVGSQASEFELTSLGLLGTISSTVNSFVDGVVCYKVPGATRPTCQWDGLLSKINLLGGGAVPTLNDDVLLDIAGGVIVVVTSAASVNNLNINAASEIIVNAGAVLNIAGTLTVAVGATLTAVGVVTATAVAAISGTLTIAAGAVVNAVLNVDALGVINLGDSGLAQAVLVLHGATTIAGSIVFAANAVLQVAAAAVVGITVAAGVAFEAAGTVLIAATASLSVFTAASASLGVFSQLSGLLVVNGLLTAATVLIGKTATFGGIGTVVGSLVNQGFLKPGDLLN